MRIYRLLTPVLLAWLCACSSAPSSTTPELTQRAKHVVVFAVPEGVRPGHWVLLIDLEGSDVRIPFTFGQ
jgi:hypothetical protein